MSSLVSGPEAIRIMVEEIGDSIGHHRIGAFERKVRSELTKIKPAGGATARDWIGAMANVIVDNDDKRADIGFRKGIKRIRQLNHRSDD